MEKKKIIIILGILIVSSAFFVLQEQTTRESFIEKETTEKKPPPSEEVVLKTSSGIVKQKSNTTFPKTGSDYQVSAKLLVGGNNYALSLPSGASLFEVMLGLSAKNKLSFSGREFAGLGFFVEEINGQKNKDGYYWTLYVNGKQSSLGASQYLVLPNDQIEWRYEKD